MTKTGSGQRYRSENHCYLFARSLFGKLAGRGCPEATFAPEKRGQADGFVSNPSPKAARFGLLVPVCPGVVPLPGQLKPAPDKAVPPVPFVPVKK